MRIDIANPYGVYMHDTPAKGIFGDDFRFVSSGCIRLQNVRDYVAWLLKETPGWDRDQIDAGDPLRRAHRREDHAQPCRSTGSMSPPGRRPTASMQFRDDIYQRDGLGLTAALPQSAPAATPVASRQAARSPQLLPVFGEEEN